MSFHFLGQTMSGLMAGVACLAAATVLPAAAPLPQPLSPAEVGGLRDYLDRHAASPEDYVIGKFADHDIVLLGEDHAIRHNLELVRRLIPRLYRAGVYTLGMEFGAEEDQTRLDALVTGPRYDEGVARRLMFNYDAGWAYREYTDLYRAAWELNRSLPAGARQFRILNLSYRYRWEDYGGIPTPAAMARVFFRGNTESFRAALIQREILARGDKLLVLTGEVHAFTRYQEPVLDGLAPGFYRLENRYMGNQLYRMAPDRVFFIELHQPFASQDQGRAGLVYPARGAIDQVMAGLAPRRVGFDLAGTAFGELPDESNYAIGHPGFRLRDLADGYIYDRPFSQYEGCTVDEHFYDGLAWPEIRAHLPQELSPRPPTLAAQLAQIRAFANLSLRYQSLR